MTSEQWEKRKIKQHMVETAAELAALLHTILRPTPSYNPISERARTRTASGSFGTCPYAMQNSSHTFPTRSARRRIMNKNHGTLGGRRARMDFPS